MTLLGTMALVSEVGVSGRDQPTILHFAFQLHLADDLVCAMLLRVCADYVVMGQADFKLQPSVMTAHVCSCMLFSA